MGELFHGAVTEKKTQQEILGYSVHPQSITWRQLSGVSGTSAEEIVLDDVLLKDKTRLQMSQ